MINASELRIGNWFLFNDHSGDPPQPYQIQGDDISRAAVNGVYHEPIPLTPEILEACGFEEHNDISPGWLLEKNGVSFYYGFPLNKRLHHILYFGIGREEVEIKMPFLHQLQNLYFALTGEELNVNIPQFAQ